MKKNIECTCPLCQTGDYDSADYYVDMSFLKKERPVGVSGLLRVKNDACFLSDCIDSCISALDELIICYQDCMDNAPEIIRKKQQQYPDKVKVYYYAPPVYCWGLTEEETKYAFSLPDTSVHKLCNYYNYTLSKATYRYVMKIDSDQIYFTEKLKRYCDAYRKEGLVKMSLGDYLVKHYAKIYRNVARKYPVLFKVNQFSLIPGVRCMIMKQYESYLLKEIINNKYALSLSGINLGYEQRRWGICLLNKYPFNGVGDHLIFCTTENTFYTTVSGAEQPIERMKYMETVLRGGWFWYHLQGMRENAAQRPKEWMALTSKLKPGKTIPDWSSLYRHQWLFFLNYSPDFPDPDQLLSETTNNIINRNKSCEMDQKPERRYDPPRYDGTESS